MCHATCSLCYFVRMRSYRLWLSFACKTASVIQLFFYGIQLKVMSSKAKVRKHYFAYKLVSSTMSWTPRIASKMTQCNDRYVPQKELQKRRYIVWNLVCLSFTPSSLAFLPLLVISLKPVRCLLIDERKRKWIDACVNYLANGLKQHTEFQRNPSSRSRGKRARTFARADVPHLWFVQPA